MANRIEDQVRKLLGHLADRRAVCIMDPSGKQYDKIIDNQNDGPKFVLRVEARGNGRFAYIVNGFTYHSMDTAEVAFTDAIFLYSTKKLAPSAKLDHDLRAINIMDVSALRKLGNRKSGLITLNIDDEPLLTYSLDTCKLEWNGYHQYAVGITDEAMEPIDSLVEIILNSRRDEGA